MADAPIAGTPAPVVPNTPTPDANAAPIDAIDSGADDVGSDIEGGDEGGEAKVAKPVTKAEKKEAAAKKKYKLKVDGRDEDVDFDPSDEAEVVRQLQLAKVSHKRMQESAEMRKGIQELLDTLRTDPMKVLADPRLQISDDVRKKLHEQILNNEIEELGKTPEQKEKERIQKDYERLKKQVEEEQKTRQELEFKMAQEKAAVDLDHEMSEAIELSGLPKTSRTVRYMAEALMFCLERDIPMTAKELIPYVKKQTLTEFKEMIGSLPDDEFESWVGKDRLTSIRKKNLAKAKAAPQDPTAIKPTGADTKKAEEAPKRVFMKDFLKSLGK